MDCFYQKIFRVWVVTPSSASSLHWEKAGGKRPGEGTLEREPRGEGPGEEALGRGLRGEAQGRDLITKEQGRRPRQEGPGEEAYVRRPRGEPRE